MPRLRAGHRSVALPRIAVPGPGSGTRVFCALAAGLTAFVASGAAATVPPLPSATVSTPAATVATPAAAVPVQSGSTPASPTVSAPAATVATPVATVSTPAATGSAPVATISTPDPKVALPPTFAPPTPVAKSASALPATG